MVFSLEHDIKVTKSYQNLLPTQSVIVVHTVLLIIIIRKSFNISSSEKYSIQADSRSPFIRNFLISQNRINMKIGS
jgi:hypothetical protein